MYLPYWNLMPMGYFIWFEDAGCHFTRVLSGYGRRTFPTSTTAIVDALLRTFAGSTTAARNCGDVYMCPGRTTATEGHLLVPGGSNRVMTPVHPRCRRKRDCNEDSFDDASGFQTMFNRDVAGLASS